MLNLTVLHSLLNFTATVHLLNISNQLLSLSPLLSSSFNSNFFISSQLSLMYIAPSNKRHKINLLLSICALQNLPASDQYTFRLDDKSVCACVCLCVCLRAPTCVCVCVFWGCYALKWVSFSTNKRVPVCVPVFMSSLAVLGLVQLFPQVPKQ